MRKWHIPYIVGMLLVMVVVLIGCVSNAPYTIQDAKYKVETKTGIYWCNDYSLDSGGTLLIETYWEQSSLGLQFHRSSIRIGGDFTLKSNQEK